MPSPEPTRTLNVSFFGAGLSSAMGLPNTPALLTELRRSGSKELLAQLDEAYRFLYPDAIYEHYQPDVVDFFSSLSAFVGIGQGWPGTKFKNGRELFRSLKKAVVKMLIDKARAIPDDSLKKHSYLTEVVRPGAVVITTNWDPLIERFAELNSLALSYSTSSGKFSDTSVTLLKLHGSVDWTSREAATRAFTITDYAALGELRYAVRPYTRQLPDSPDSLVRVRTKWSSAWQTVASRTREPWIVTMVSGKQDELGPLASVWRDAYSALGRASSLEITGYSLPADDVEVRTLLRAGMQRGNSNPKSLLVRDPSPAVHARFRTLLDHHIESNFVGVPPH